MKLSAKLFTPDLKPSVYYDLLKAFCSAYRALERAAGNVPMIANLLVERSKISLLEQDLQHIKNRLETVNDDFPASTLPKTDSEALSLGMMYVMEGATLGGKQIVNYLERFAWIELENSLNFFNSYGDDRGKMWKEFIEVLEKYAESNPSERDTIVKGAYQAFSHIDKAITRV